MRFRGMIRAVKSVFGANTVGIVAGGLVAIVALIGAYLIFGESPATQPPAPETPVAVSEPVVIDDSSGDTAAAEDPIEQDVVELPEAPQADEPVEEAAVQMPPPLLDTIRIEPDGNGVIAGRAAPGAVVDVLIDGKTVETVVADAAGGFVAFLTLEPSENPRILSLLADPAGDAVPSSSSQIIGPTISPVIVAEADTTDEPQPQAAEEAVVQSTETASVDPVGVAETDVVVPATEADEPAPAVAQTESAEATTVPEPESDLASQSDEDNADAPVAETETVETEATGSDTLASVDTADAADVLDAQPEQSGEEVAASETTQEVDVAPSAPAILNVTEDGVEVIQPSTSETSPDVVAAVALDTITYDPSGEVFVAGRATGGGVIRIYLDNALKTSTEIGTDNRWSTTLSPVDPGIYTLRVDQVDDDGKVLSRIESPFKREEPEAIAEAMADEAEQIEEAGVAVRTVQPGNTLWAIARDQYGEGILYVHVFEANKDRIRNPDLIYPGQVFVLPELEDE